MNAALDAARMAQAEVRARVEIRFECRRGVHGDVVVMHDPGCKSSPAAWCCGVSMKRVKGEA